MFHTVCHSPVVSDSDKLHMRAKMNGLVSILLMFR